MAKIKYDAKTLALMSYFESQTRCRVRECFTDMNGILNFIINDKVYKAIGKNSANLKKIESKLRKKIKITEYSEDIIQFTSNLLKPLKTKEITYDPELKKITITPEPESRGYIIGRAAQNLKNYESIIRRHFPLEKIEVV